MICCAFRGTGDEAASVSRMALLSEAGRGCFRPADESFRGILPRMKEKKYVLLHRSRVDSFLSFQKYF